MAAVSLKDVQAAASRIARIAHRTPVSTSRTFDARTGLAGFFKCENFQRGGAFKIRGAANFLYAMNDADLPRGVVTFSSGNHAQAVAIAAASRGCAATIVMPEDAPRSKLAATRGYGASVVTYNRFQESREAIGRRISEQTGATLVPPYDHEWIIAGQGTIALELLDQAPGLDALVTPVGGGGMLAGCSLSARAINPKIRVFGAEPEGASDTYQSFREGRRVTITPDTIADGLRSPAPGEMTLPIMRENAEDILLVSEDEIRRTMLFFLTRMKMLVEPSGAVAAAAVLYGKLPPGLKRVGIVISGGNADLDILATLPSEF